MANAGRLAAKAANRALRLFRSMTSPRRWSQPHAGLLAVLYAYACIQYQTEKGQREITPWRIAVLLETEPWSRMGSRDRKGQPEEKQQAGHDQIESRNGKAPPNTSGGLSRLLFQLAVAWQGGEPADLCA